MISLLATGVPNVSMISLLHLKLMQGTDYFLLHNADCLVYLTIFNYIFLCVCVGIRATGRPKGSFVDVVNEGTKLDHLTDIPRSKLLLN